MPHASCISARVGESLALKRKMLINKLIFRASYRGEALLTAGGPDYTLQSILSHIAYVNQTALDYRLSRKLSRKNQV